MAHYNGLIKCSKNKVFTDILIKQGIITEEELVKYFDKLVMPKPFPNSHMSEECIKYRKDNARKLFDQGNYEQLMIEAFAFLNSMGPDERPNCVLNIICFGKFEEQILTVYSCYSSNNNHYMTDSIGNGNKSDLYFDTEEFKFYDKDKKQIDYIVDFDDYEIIRVSYGYK